MAKVTWMKSNGGHEKLFHLDECEDWIYCDALLEIKRLRPGFFVNVLNQIDIWDKYFNEGKAVRDRSLAKVNGALAQLGLSPVSFVSGHSTGHSMMRGDGKASLRDAMREKLEALEEKGRTALILAKRKEAEALAEQPIPPIPDGAGHERPVACRKVVTPAIDFRERLAAVRKRIAVLKADLANAEREEGVLAGVVTLEEQKRTLLEGLGA